MGTRLSFLSFCLEHKRAEAESSRCRSRVKRELQRRKALRLIVLRCWLISRPFSPSSRSSAARKPKGEKHEMLLISNLFLASAPIYKNFSFFPNTARKKIFFFFSFFSFLSHAFSARFCVLKCFSLLTFSFFFFASFALALLLKPKPVYEGRNVLKK